MLKDQFHSDEWTLDDFIDHSMHVKSVGDMIEGYSPPFVLGIHGDWGSGKTSFLRKLHLYLGGENSGYEEAEEKCKSIWGDDYQSKDNIETIWFDAWKYQTEANPVVALLNEIRSHFTLTQQIKGKAAKYTFTALMSLGELTKKFGLAPEKIYDAGQRWEKETLSQPLPSQLCRDLLEQAIQTLLEKQNEKKDEKDRKLIIFVDDLDRCMGPVAFKFLEAMKVYFAISNCVFILGLDVRHVRRAVAAELKSAGIISEESKQEQESYAANYLDKMFQSVFHLPVITDFKEYLSQLLDDSVFKEKEKWIKTIKDFNLLPPNPRRIKYFVNGLTFYVNQITSDEEINHELALIFAYLKYMANDIFRILEADNSFWVILKKYCMSGKNETQTQALDKLLLPDKPSEIEEGQFESKFYDPADERLFRVAQLIRDFRKDEDEIRPIKDEFKRYLLKK